MTEGKAIGMENDKMSVTEIDTALKQCPFCGAAAKIVNQETESVENNHGAGI